MSDCPFPKGRLRGIYRNADAIETLSFTGKPINTPLCLPCQCFTGPGLSRASTRGCIIPGGESLFTQQQSLSNAVNYSLFQKGIYHNAETTETLRFTDKLSNTPRLRCASAPPPRGNTSGTQAKGRIISQLQANLYLHRRAHQHRNGTHTV